MMKDNQWGVIGPEPKIALIALYDSASVFDYVVLPVGSPSSQKAKEAIYERLEDSGTGQYRAER